MDLNKVISREIWSLDENNNHMVSDFNNYGDLKVDSNFNLYNGSEKIGEAIFFVRNMSISYDDGARYVIKLDQININEEYRTNGYGEKFIDQLCKYADGINGIIILTASSDFGSNKNRLISWYKKHDFFENKGKNKDFRFQSGMIRLPKNNSINESLNVSSIPYKKSLKTNKGLNFDIEVFNNQDGDLEIKSTVDGKTISRVLGDVDVDNRTLRIHNALVYPEYRRMGLYSEIVSEFESLSKKFNLKMIDDDDRSDDAKLFWKNRINNEGMENNINNIINDEINKIDENPDRLTIDDPNRSDNGKSYGHMARQGKGHAYGFGYYKGEFLIGERAAHWTLGTLENGEEMDRKEMKYPGRLWVDPKVITFWIYPSPSELKTIANDINSEIGLNIWSQDWSIEIVNDPTLQQKLSNRTGTGGEEFREDSETTLIPVPEYQGSGQRSAAEISKPHEKSPMPPNWNQLYNKGYKKYAQESLDKYFGTELNEDESDYGNTQFDIKEFDKLTSFAARKRYAENMLVRLSAGGSSRLVYDLKDGKVLKLAANKKGLDQNYAESGLGNDHYYNSFMVTKVFDSHPDDYWLVSEKAEKINPSRFKEITGVDVREAGAFVKQKMDEDNGRRVNYNTFSDERYEELSENEFLYGLLQLTRDYDLGTGDLGRITSYGVVKREGQDTVVLLDYGGTNDVMSTHYSGRQNEGLYDDIGELSDTSNTNVVDGGYSGFALKPQSVSEILEDLVYSHVTDASPENDKYEIGDETINESVSYSGVILDDKSRTSLIQKFSDKIPNDWKFIAHHMTINLGELSNKEIIGDDVQLIVNSFSIDDNVAAVGVKGYESSNSKPHITIAINAKIGAKPKMSNDLENWDSIMPFYVNGKVREIEFTPQKQMVGVNELNEYTEPQGELTYYHGANKRINTFVDEYVGGVDANDQEGPGIYFTSSIDDARQYGDFIHTVKLTPQRLTDENSYEYLSEENIFELIMKSPSVEDYATNWAEDVESGVWSAIGSIFTYADNEKDLFQQVWYEFFKKDPVEFVRAMVDAGYDGQMTKGYSNDEISHIVMYNPNEIEIISVEENVSEIQEDNVINEAPSSLSSNDANKIVKHVADKVMGFKNVKPLGDGTFGYAYDLGHNMVLKISTDQSEAVESIKLKGKTLNYVSNIYNVYKMKFKDRDYYLIHLEKLDTREQKKFLNYNQKLTDIFENSSSDETFVDSVLEHDTRFDNGDVDIILNDYPNEKKYYYDLINIRTELENYGIESRDFINPLNLGYKQNGNLGFFDVGFGDYYFGKEKPIELQMHEERIKTYMPNASRVKVKGKCVIGGNGDGTSTACNQGDINNLELSNMNESIESKIEYGCLMADFSHIKNWEDIIGMIDKEDLFEPSNGFGLEENPHVTILYGFHDEVNSTDIQSLLNNQIDFPIEITLDKISIFNNGDYDVVKFDVTSDDLVKLNELVKELPHTSTFPEYIPHMTLAYVKSGMGEKYVRTIKDPIKQTTYKIKYSDADENYSTLGINDLNIGTSINEDIDAKEGLGPNGLNTVLSGKRDLAFVNLTDHELENVDRRGFGCVPIDQGKFKFNNRMYIVHRNEKKARRLKQILDRNGGYLRNRNPDEVREIGELLSYKNEDIESFIVKIFGNQ